MIRDKHIDIFHDAAIYCMKAKTLIEQEDIIEEAIEEYEQSKWIRFDPEDVNTMPAHGDSVLCVIPKGSYHYSMTACTFDYGTRKFYKDCDDSESVTHWQPLPEPPKEVLEND